MSPIGVLEMSLVFLNTIYKAAVATTSPVVHSVKAIKVSGAGILRPELTKIKGKIITFTQSR